MSSNVDDFLCGYLPEGAEVINSVLQQFLVGKEERRIFRFCGDKTKTLVFIHVTAIEYTERIQQITCDLKHGLTRKATADEIHQLRSVKKSLAWIARQTRPDLSNRTSKIQSTFENACVRNLRECNRIVEYATSTSTRGIYFSPESSWEDARLLRRSVTPVSANNNEQIGTSNHNRVVSQLWLLGNALNTEKILIHPLSSTRIRRVCHSTLMAEAHALSNVVEHGLRTRATIVGMRGQPNIRQLEETASAAMGHVKSLCTFGFSQYQTSRHQTLGD